MTTKMRDSELPLSGRIVLALRRIADGNGLMRVPVEATDPDIVLGDCIRALDYYRAGLEQRAPKWVPCRVLLQGPVRGDYPIGHTTLAEVGIEPPRSGRLK